MPFDITAAMNEWAGTPRSEDPATEAFERGLRDRLRSYYSQAKNYLGQYTPAGREARAAQQYQQEQRRRWQEEWESMTPSQRLEQEALRSYADKAYSEMQANKTKAANSEYNLQAAIDARRKETEEYNNYVKKHRKALNNINKVGDYTNSKPATDDKIPAPETPSTEQLMDENDTTSKYAYENYGQGMNTNRFDRSYDIDKAMEARTFSKALTEKTETNRGTVLSDPLDPAEVYNENTLSGLPFSNNMFRAMQLVASLPPELLDLIASSTAEENEVTPITADGRNARQVERDILKGDALSVANTSGGMGVPDAGATPELAENIDAIVSPSTVLGADIADGHIVDTNDVRGDPNSSFNAIAGMLERRDADADNRAMHQISRKIDKDIAAGKAAKRKADIEQAMTAKNEERFGGKAE